VTVGDRDYRARPIISAKEPAPRTAGMPAPTLAAAPVFVAEAADWLAVEVGVTIGVEVAGKVVMLELGEAVTEFTRIRVLVIVVVDWEVVSSATAT